MAIRRISHARGKGSINHNNRNHIYKNVGPLRTKNNIYYAKESLDEAYQKCFGEALNNYNTKQKRADRKIEDYYKHLFGNAQKDSIATSSNKEKSFYEIAVGIGDRTTCPVGSADGELAAKILDEYARCFQSTTQIFMYSILYCTLTKRHRICILTIFQSQADIKMALKSVIANQ